MSRKRSLAETNHKILKRSQIIDTTLRSLLTKDRALNVLEVGFGYGRTLLELAWKFRDEDITFYGVDKSQEPMEECENLIGIVRKHGFLPEKELADVELPTLFFYDATRLHFEDSSMDLIYSAVTIRFMERKAEFLEEVCRVLKPGGVALLHIGESNWNYPYSLICHDKILTPYMNRFILKYGNELIPLPIFLSFFEEDAFKFDFINNPRCVVRISKFKPARLSLQLIFNSELCISMKELPFRHGSGKVRGGVRSVYDVRAEAYDALFEKKLLSREQLRTDIQISEEFNKGNT